MSFQFGRASMRLPAHLAHFGAAPEGGSLILPDNHVCAIERKITFVRFEEGAP
jgi:hypothetical protein